MDNAAKRFFDVCSYLSPGIACILRSVPQASAAAAEEIRLRAGMPLTLYISGRPAFIGAGGGLSFAAGEQAVVVRPSDIHETFLRMCEYSVHSRQEELSRGFLTLPGGHRAGLCGTAVHQNGELSAIKDLSSINLRIAREFKGCAANIMSALPPGFGGLLIAGRPGSGKTTLLRDIARILSSGEFSAGVRRFFKVAVVDQRGELAAMCGGQPQNDLGLQCDVLSGCAKEEGIEMAVRTLSPDFIIFDEVGSANEATAIAKGMFAGVRFIASVHASGMESLARNRTAARLTESGAFSHIALLKDAPPGTVSQIIEHKGRVPA